MTTNRDKLLAKIRALLSKTVENGCTEAEAMAAINMASAMMDAYEVTEDDLKLEGEKAEVKEDDSFDPHKIRQNLAVCISEFCEVKVWKGKERSHKLNFCGLNADVEFALWLLDSLSTFVANQLAWHIAAHRYEDIYEKKYHMASFIAGCTKRINERLKELIDQKAPKRSRNSNALMVIKNELIAKRMNELGIHLKKNRDKGREVNWDSFKAGQMAGDRASFGRPVNSPGGTLRIGKR